MKKKPVMCAASFTSKEWLDALRSAYPERFSSMPKESMTIDLCWRMDSAAGVLSVEISDPQ